MARRCGRWKKKRNRTFEERIATFLDDALERGVQGVVILLNELGGLVADSSGKVAHQEALIVTNLSVFTELGFARQGQSEVSGIGCVDSLREMASAWLGQFRFFIQQMEDSVVLGLDQINAILIVDVDDFLDAQTFLFVEKLLFFEDSQIEKLLQFLVAVIDAKLFETVDGKVLESGNVQDADVTAGWLERNALIDSMDDEIK